ncbi:MAG: hypothetical protein KatS3mg118_0514 [Paracoccaceae bacterium]|nr:MAG: hypothetical protein KatS3mg118_0514 [Paracoccaceae bacterium]
MSATKTDPAKAAADVMKDATQRMEAFATDTQKAMTAQIEKLTRGFEKAATFNLETFEAVIRSTEIATKAVEGMNAELVDFGKKSFEEGVAATKAMTSAKSVAELFEKQAEFARASMDSYMRQLARVNEMYISAARSAAEPLGARLTAVSDVMKSFAS